MITLNLESLYTETAKLSDLATYEAKALELAGQGNVVKLTGKAPVWLYLRIAHALHGKARTFFMIHLSLAKWLSLTIILSRSGYHSGLYTTSFTGGES